MTAVVYCERYFRDLTRDPLGQATLITLLISGTLPPHQLSFAAEIAGRLPAARDALLSLLRHASAVVREGAVYGLANFVGDPAIRDRLYALSLSDVSPAVAEAAAEALEP